MTSCGDDEDDEDEPKQENVDNGGNNQNQNGGNDQNQNGGNDQNQNGGNDQNQNEQKGIVGTWVLNAKESVSKQDGEAVEDYDDMLGSRLTFNADGTITGDDDMSGKYSLNGNYLTIEYVEDGKTVTMRRGEQLSLSAEDVAEIKEGFEEMGIPTAGVDIIISAFVVSMEELSADVNGDKLTINYVVSTKLDKNKLGIYAAMASDEMLESLSSTLESKLVFDRK